MDVARIAKAAVTSAEGLGDVFVDQRFGFQREIDALLVSGVIGDLAQFLGQVVPELVVVLESGL